MTSLTLHEALWFLPVAMPISAYVAYSDLSQMRIPNTAVYAMVIGFAALGLFALPFEVYLWRWCHLMVVLAFGIVLSAIGIFGAGDAKYMAAIAPYISVSDTAAIFYILSLCIFSGIVVHRLAMYSFLRKLAPDWKSWSAGRNFPLGFPISMAIVVYLSSPLF